MSDEAQAEIRALKARISDLKLALGDNAGWFDRAMAAERARDAVLDRLVSPDVVGEAARAMRDADHAAAAFAALSAARAFLLKS